MALGHVQGYVRNKLWVAPLWSQKIEACAPLVSALPWSLPARLSGLRNISFRASGGSVCGWAQAAAQTGWGACLRRAPLHRPVKVERTRKRSEGLPLDKKVEKKKGEGPAVRPWEATEGRRAGPGWLPLAPLALCRSSVALRQSWSVQIGG
jgi:hypothetical protein